jgi:hypothetical protein
VYIGFVIPHAVHSPAQVAPEEMAHDHLCQAVHCFVVVVARMA